MASTQHAELLGLKVRSSAQLHAKVSEGLEFDTVERFQRNTALPMASLSQWLVIPSRTLSRRKSEHRLRPDESDRLLRASRIYAKAIETFGGDREAATRWLGAPQRGLGDAVPLEFARTDVGCREVEDLLGRLEDGVFT